MNPFTAAAILAASITAAMPLTAEECHPSLLEIQRSDAQGNPVFSVAIADEPAEMSRGLMEVATMPADAGMLFAYPRAGKVAFWMKNT